MKQFTKKMELNAYIQGGCEEMEESGLAWILMLEEKGEFVEGYVLSETERIDNTYGEGGTCDPLFGYSELALGLMEMYGKKCRTVVFSLTPEGVRPQIYYDGTCKDWVFKGTSEYLDHD